MEESGLMQFDCPECGLFVAEEQNGEEGVVYIPLNKSTVTHNQNEAPRVRCARCGHVLIIVRGSPWA